MVISEYRGALTNTICHDCNLTELKLHKRWRRVRSDLVKKNEENGWRRENRHFIHVVVLPVTLITAYIEHKIL